MDTDPTTMKGVASNMKERVRSYFIRYHSYIVVSLLLIGFIFAYGIIGYRVFLWLYHVYEVVEHVL